MWFQSRQVPDSWSYWREKFRFLWEQQWPRGSPVPTKPPDETTRSASTREWTRGLADSHRGMMSSRVSPKRGHTRHSHPANLNRAGTWSRCPFRQAHFGKPQARAKLFCFFKFYYYRVRRRKFNFPLKRFPDSSKPSRILVGWREEGHPATKNLLQHSHG